MHVRIAWEIYNHQHKQSDPANKPTSSLNPADPSSNPFNPSIRDSNLSPSSNPNPNLNPATNPSLNPNNLGLNPNSRILSGELNKRPGANLNPNSNLNPGSNPTENEKNKFAAPVLSRPIERQNLFGVDGRISQQQQQQLQQQQQQQQLQQQQQQMMMHPASKTSLASMGKNHTKIQTDTQSERGIIII